MEKVKKIKIGCKPYEVYDPSAHERIDQLEQRDLLENITVEAHVDDTTGTPNVNVVKGENKITLNFSGLKGQPGIDGLDAVGEQGPEGPQGETGPEGPQGPQGEPGYDGKTGKTPHITANATYDASIAGNSPHVHVDVDGTDENPVFNFRFSGLRGKDGVDGQDGQNGYDGSNYDDSQLRNKIQQVENDLANKWNSIDQKIQNDVDDIVNDSQWLEELSGKVQSQSNFGDSDVDAYLQRIGLYTEENGTRTWAWSTIQQEINNIWIAVRAIETGVDPTDLTALEASLRTYVDTQTSTAFANLHSEYARKDAEKIIEWMYSELDQGAGPEQTWNDLVSAAGGNGSGAIANVSTNIKKLANNEYLATANLVSEITANKAGIATALASAGVLTTADLNNASSTLYSKLGEKYAAVDTAVTKDSSGNIQSGVTINADQINLQGHVWADDINASSVVATGLNNLSSNKVSVTGNGIVVTNGSTATTTVMPGQIQLGSSGVGTNYVSNGSLTIGYMQYSSSDNVLRVGAIETNSEIKTNKVRSVNGDSANIQLSSSENGHGGTVIVNAEATISLVSPNIVCSGGKLTLSANGENVDLTADTLKRLIQMLENQ